MYLFCALLAHKAEKVAINVKLLSDKTVRCTQRKGTAGTEGRLQQYWAEYQAGTRSVTRIYAPAQ